MSEPAIVNKSKKSMAQPKYLQALKNKTLHQRAEYAWQMLEHCTLCPRKCGVNRLKNERGFCQTGRNAIVCSAFAHLGEEPPISGTRGSGAIFFSHCSMRCVYCQNHGFSQEGEGVEVSLEELSRHMCSLQDEGCHNINVITPTHVMPQILEALILAAEQGLKIPLVYNTSGYELPEVLGLLDSIVDVYLPDMRYADQTNAVKYSAAPSYPENNRKSILEMHRQVGIARIDEEGIIQQGLIIRHLVLPEQISGTEEILSFIAKHISPETHVSLMSQYFPTFEANLYPPLDRRLHLEEYEAAVELLKKYNLANGWIQESGGLKRFAGTNIKRNV
ncbi:MAG: radical SAM protein [Candidatus Omnitrophota bacterium]